MKYRPLGELKLRRVVESQWAFPVEGFFPHSEKSDWEPYIDWIGPEGFLRDSWQMRMPMQSYIIQTKHHNILVDTCCGPDKNIPHRPEWHQNKQQHYIDNLNAHGLTFEDIDFVMCSHLHTDHTGWNTRLMDGRWVPTFPNARYIIGRKEFDYWDHIRNSVYEQNVLPVIEAGMVDFVESDFSLDDTVWLEESAGHTPGHYCVHAKSRGEHAVFTGDMLHSPIQCIYPDWQCAFDWDKEMASKARKGLMDRYADTNILICTIHFPLPSVGYLERRGKAFRFRHDSFDW